MTRRHYFLIALLPVLVLAVWHWLSPARQLAAVQQRFLSAVSEKDEAAVLKLLHPDYTDQWGFSAADWPGILKDLRSLSPILEIKTVNPAYDAGAGVVDTALQAASGGGPAAQSLESQSASLSEPTRFIWKRAPWRPWSWQLVSIQNPAIGIPADYRPGKFSSGALPEF